MSKEGKKQHWDIRVFTYRTFAVFISMLLLSNVGLAAGRDDVKAQQQPRSQQATHAAAERATTLGISVQAQTKQSITPKFTSSEQASKLKLQTDGKPFIPAGLGRSAKPNEGGVIRNSQLPRRHAALNAISAPRINRSVELRIV